MADEPKKLPPTVEDLDRRLAQLEAKRDGDSLNDDEIKELRAKWKTLKKDEGNPEEATDGHFLDWLFE